MKLGVFAKPFGHKMDFKKILSESGLFRNVYIHKNTIRNLIFSFKRWQMNDFESLHSQDSGM